MHMVTNGDWENWVYLDVSQVCVKLLGHVGAQARCRGLLLFVTNDLIPENILIGRLKSVLTEAKSLT